MADCDTGLVVYYETATCINVKGMFNYSMNKFRIHGTRTRLDQHTSLIANDTDINYEEINIGGCLIAWKFPRIDLQYGIVIYCSCLRGYVCMKLKAVSGEKRVSQWEELMRKFFEAHKEECKAVPVDIPRVPRSVKQFPTGSHYEGTWDVLGMSGYGVYTFPNGVIYEGEFDDGMFHGRGELRYPCGAILRGKWTRGNLDEKTLLFADGSEYCESDWQYCMMPDRRYTIERNTELQPAGKTYLTADQPTREIPVGYFDTGDGFFDPKTKAVYKEDLLSIIRYPSEQEQKWIEENCRRNPDLSVGPRLDLYEEWSLPLTQFARATSVASSFASFAYNRDLDTESERLPGGGFFDSPTTSGSETDHPL